MNKTNWQSLPFELKEQILQAIELPAIDDGTFTTYLEKDDYDLNSDEVQDLAKQHARAQLSVIENLFLVCKDFGYALVPALQRHIEETQRHQRQIEIRCDEYEDETDSCEGCGGYHHDERVKCYQAWENYLDQRLDYARRLMKHFEKQS